MADHVQADLNADAGRPPTSPRAAAPSAGGGRSPFTIIKQGQGTHVRWATAVGAGVLAIGLTAFVHNKLTLIQAVEENLYLRTLLPVLVLVAAAYGIFWAVARQPKVVEFLIATEGEMKKVNWSSRREVWGATKVVIVTVFALAFMLFVVDTIFIFFFSSIGVLHFNLSQFFHQGS
jgi:preprotein translocase subunit SecE